MTTSNFVPMKLILWVFAGLICLSAGCQAGLQEEAVTENINIPDEPAPTMQLQTPVIPTTTPEKIPSTPTMPPLIQPTATATKQLTSTATPMPTVTATEGGFSITQIYPQIALLCGEPGSYSAICTFDTQANVFEIIAQPTERFSHGRPLWSPDKELLAFARFDFETGVPYMQIYNSDTEGSNYLVLTEAQPLDDDTLPGTFLYGWSNNAEWLSYDYFYEQAHPNSHLIYLVNVLTQENTPVALPNPENYSWFVWSSHHTAFAITNGETIYIGNPDIPNELTAYRGNGFLGLMAWHPTRNELLVGSKRNPIEEGLSQLRQLNIDTGEWTDISIFPHMAHFEFSPDGQFIAVHSQSRSLEKYRLEIIDASTFEPVKQIELPARLFFDLDWSDNRTVALTANDNIYVIPLEEPEKAYWIFDDANPLYKEFSQIAITDW